MRPVPPLPTDVRDEIARSPGHLVCSRTLNRMGHGSWRITDWVRRRLLERVAPGWYRMPGDRPPLQDAHLAQSYVTARHPLSPVALTAGHSLQARGCVLPDLPRPLVLVPHGRRIRLPEPALFGVAQRVGLDRLQTVPRDGLRCADLATALSDLVVQRDPSDDAEGDAGLRAELYTVLTQLRVCRRTLVSALAAMDHTGARRLTRLARDGSFEHDSPAEWSLYHTTFLPYPPAPDCQVWLTPRIRVDFVYLFAALVIEYHGEAAHAGRLDDDAARVFTLRQLGLDTLVVTRSMARNPRELAVHVHDVRRQREDLMLRGQLRHPSLPPQPRPRLTPLRTLGPLG